MPTDENAQELNGIALSPYGRSLLASRTPMDETIEVWDLRRRVRVKVIRDVGGRTMVFHPDQRTLVTSHGQIIDLRSGRVTRHSITPDDTTTLAISESGRHLAAGDLSGRVTMWDGRGGHRLAVLPGTFSGTRGGEPEPVTGLQFSPDGRTLAVAGGKGTLQLWDVASNQPLGDALPTPEDPLLALAFSPDGGTLYAAGAHVPLQKYVIGAQKAAADVCQRARGALSRADWQVYLPEVPYRKTC
ncbi:hypothetical protein [Streptomyces sp. NPDC005407]|uniref:WD40 repeat domain-containing protein n=1 Tax=Streptomyces sp. NPDC005407 TaxID=3155340 RepID=UPI0033A81782